MRINKHDTNGTKPLLGKGELGYDDYAAGGDTGRVYVGTGTENIPVAKKTEVDSHVNRIDNPHSVTKTQVGLGNVDNTADANKNVLSATKWTTARTITLSGDVAGSASMDGTANVSITTTVQPNSVALGTDTTGNYVAGITQGTGITVSGTAGEGWSPTIAITDVGTAGTYTKVTTNAQGQVTSGTTLSATDIPSLDASKITTGTLPVVQGGTGVTTSTGTGSVVLSTSPILTTPDIGVATGTSFNSITGLASVAPLVAGTAAVGTSTLTARQDHVHPAQTSVTGNAGTATALQTARTIGASGDVTGTATSFNGSANITIPMTLTNSGVTAGTYSKVTVDTKGRVTAGLTPTMEDIPDATFKRSVRCATTANITLSGTQTIDDIAVVVGDRVLVKNQTTTSQNGIYVVATSTWTRALDANSSSKIASAIVAVDSGTVNGGKLFDTNFKTTDTLGTTSMLWNMNIDDGSLLTAGSTSVGMVKYNGTTPAAGNFNGGTLTPTGATRLNYDGYFYPTYLNLAGSVDTTTASSHVFVETSTDGFVRPKTLANFKTEIFASPTLVTPNIGVATGTSFNSITGLSATTPLMNGTAAVGTSVTVARADHVHPIDTSRAPLASPAFTGAPTVNNVAFSGYSGFKNYIINGNLDVWQRGISQTSDGYGSDDRWCNGNVGSTKTHSPVTCTDTERALFNANNYSRTVVTSVAGASNYCVKIQRVEDVNKLAGKTVTLSFWAKANSNKNIALELGQSFGTGGTPSPVVYAVGSQLVALTSTWQKKTITITLPSIVGKTLGTDGLQTTYTYVTFWFDAGSSFNSRAANLGQQSGTFDIAQVQLEEGSVATPFEQRPFGLELSLCQRYYRIGRGAIQKHSTAGPHKGTQPLDILYDMRVTPTIIFSKSGTQTGANALSFSATSVGMSVWGDTDYDASNIGDYTIFDFKASAEL